MSDSAYIVELDDDNFQEIVLAGGNQVPVLVDFWADWCQPCKMLMPVLSRLAAQYQGKFILGKLNTEEHQEIASQFGIRSLPTVKLFRGGEVVDEFMGALPESEIREFLDKHIPRESDGIIATAQQHLLQGDGETAIALLQRAAELDPDNPRVTIALAQVQAAMGDAQGALSLLDTLDAEQQQQAEAKSLRSHLHFEALAEQQSRERLQQRLQADDQDHEARLLLAAHHVTEQQYAEALDLLLEILRRERNFDSGVAQKNMLQIFEILGDDPMVGQYRNKMLNLLY